MKSRKDNSELSHQSLSFISRNGREGGKTRGSQKANYCRGWGEASAAAAKSLQLCPTLCDPIDSSPLGSPGPGILQARTLEWVAISFSNA